MKEFEMNEEIYGMIIDDMDQAISPEDKALLEDWRKANPANEKTYQDFLNVQLNLDKLYGHVDADANRSWEGLNKKLDDQQSVLKVVKPMKRRYAILRIAAIFLVALGVGFYFIRETPAVTIHTDPGAKTAEVLLPDGTKLTLAASTTVKYDKDNFLKDRKLELVKGEIFIKVAKGKVQFRVDLGDVEAKDIGTSFNIFRDEKEVSVTVEQGIVALRQPAKNQEVTLIAGKSGFYQEDTELLLVRENSNPNYKAWVDKSFMFTETPLTEVASQLEKSYQVKIEIRENQLKQRNFTGRLNYPEIDAALAVISESLQCKVTKSNGVYVFHDN